MSARHRPDDRDHYSYTHYADPKNARAHAVLGTARASRHAFGESEKELRAALQSDPQCGLAYAGYGDFYLLQRKMPEAEKALRRAIALDPGTAFPHKVLGTLLSDERRYEEAERELRASLPLYARDGLDFSNTPALNLYLRHGFVETVHAIGYGLEIRSG